MTGASMANDSRTHAVLSNGAEVRRHHRGKWYLVYPVEQMIPYRRLKIDEAVRLTVEDAGATVYFDLPGGLLFDVRVQEMREQRS